MRAFSFAYVFQVKVKITLMSECYATERQKFLTLTCLQLSGQLSYADRATGHKSTGRAAATAMREKRDGENASDVEDYCGEGVWVMDGISPVSEQKDGERKRFGSVALSTGRSGRFETWSVHNRTRIDAIRKIVVRRNDGE